MFPILFTIGRFHIYNFSVFIILAWCVFSFMFWRMLRSDGVDEDKIFDLTFYSTLVAFICSRAFFVCLNWDLFADTWLKIFALWVQPGLSLYGAFIGGLLTLVFVSRREKVRLGQVLDAFALSFPGAFAVGLIGSFLDGTEVGKIVNLPWAMRVVGHVGRRQPIQIYEFIAIVFMMVILFLVKRKSVKEKWAYGVVGVWFFMMYSIIMFILEFFKESRVYWISLSANQWVLIALFAEAVGAFYVRGGGRETVRPLVYKLRTLGGGIAGGIYAKFSKRRPE
jgi:phosphatidylglycerol---prolipoprotein diacylglyceryl transferase